MHKYEVEYCHKIVILDSGSSMRPRLMKCSECGLFTEIYDGHITYSIDNIPISSCRDPNGGFACLGWPDVPECGIAPLCKKEYLTKKIINA